MTDRWNDPSEPYLVKRDGGERRYAIRVRPGMSEGQYLGVMLRCWGPGHWCIANGEPHFYTRREHAIEAGDRWIERGNR